MNKKTETDIQVLKKALDDKEDYIEDLKMELEDKEDEIKDLKQQVRNKEGHIKQLLEVEREYERQKTSRPFKIIMFFTKISHTLFPLNSKRRFFVKVILKCIRHPLFIFKALNPRRIKKYVQTVKTEGMEGVNNRFNFVSNDFDQAVGTYDVAGLDIIPVRASGKSKRKDVYKAFDIPETDKPLVSIVIPVYNQFDYTYKCIRQIKKHSGNVPYEIIIADDCSTDTTRNIENIITGIKVIHNERNLRFLLNCNNAAKEARGEFILFLNNDTQVQENWLQPLVDVMKDKTVGMTGSKLVYSNGALQEAGGILWKDGSAWNYGNRKNPDAPEFNYVKEVDYISGAAIMIRRSLWEEIGGFDERFAPAYCEDSDLAFEVRKHGYKVVYQPLSVVVHFEGVSNGTDTSSGQKAYQVTNQKKFYEKWKDELDKNHYPNAENVFLARDRSGHKPVVLMVDHYTPQFDKDAGSRTVYAYLQLFLEKGYNVKFIGDNFFKDPVYTIAVEQLGIEVLYGNYYSQHWKDWIKENGIYIKYVFLNRPHISVKYIGFLRKNTKARIMYYGHDLHFLREYREYELTKNPELLALSEDWKKKELDLFKRADVVYYPSQVEVDEIKKNAPNVNAKAIVAYMYDDVEERPYNIDRRQDIMFIGGFGHPPNEDGVLWFLKEVFPIVHKAIPDLTFHILGSNPTEKIKEMASDNVKVHGFVTDEELEDYYNNSRISVVPLRVGAGIKGKVIEAMRYGVPVVTTTIGAEGILNAEDILCVEDEPEKMADSIIKMYNDEALLSEKAKRSYKYVQKYYTKQGAWDVIAEDFQ